MTTVTQPGKKVLVAMDGGMHGIVAAAVLKNQGYQVAAIGIQLCRPGTFEEIRDEFVCCRATDLTRAKAFAKKLDVVFEEMDLSGAFEAEVVDYVIHEYLQARTPGPCVSCIKTVRFDALIRKADEMGFDFIATGHYAQIQYDVDTGLARLARAVTPTQDESYFLYALPQEMLNRTLLPLGGIPYEMIERLGAELGALDFESGRMDRVCFAGSGRHIPLIESRTPENHRQPGVIQTVDGFVISDHDGIYKFDYGSRQDVKVSVKDADHLVVVGKQERTNVVVIGGEEHLYRRRIRVARINWVQSFDMLRVLHCYAVWAPGADEVPCGVVIFENETAVVEFKDGQKGLIPGQMIVFYRDGEVLGGGRIEALLE